MNSKRFGLATLVLLAASVSSVTARQSQTAGAELQKFQGSWVMVSAEVDGKPIDAALAQQGRITFTGNRIELVTPHQSAEPIIATLAKIDETTTPKRMHWMRSSGPNSGVTMVAIYEFDGPDQYKIVFDPTGQVVPTEFATKAGSGHIWHTWKRVK